MYFKDMWEDQRVTLCICTVLAYQHIIQYFAYLEAPQIVWFTYYNVMIYCRLFDHSMEGFKNWEFMTTHCWSEKAAGDWILEICDTPSQLRNFKTPGMNLTFIWAQ